MSQIEAGFRLRAARRSLGLSVAKVSDLVGASTSTVKRWEQGKGLPSGGDVQEYLKKIGASDSVIFDLDLEESAGRVTQRMLRAKRRRAMLTLEEVSALTGICVASLHRYETGERSPDPLALAPLALAYGCSAEEASLLCGRPEETAASALTGFLSPGSVPHFWLFHRLESKLRPNAELSPDDVQDLIQGFMFMGDHRSLLEAWELIKPATQGIVFTPAQTATIAMTLALARYTVSGDKRAARERVSKIARSGVDLPPNAMSHLARLAAALGDFDEADRWLDQLAFYASRVGDEGQLFVSEVNRVMFTFAKTRSPTLFSALDLLRSRAGGPLQIYTLDVAELHMLDVLGEREAANIALQRCVQHEQTYGVGSPLAARIRARMSRIDGQHLRIH